MFVCCCLLRMLWLVENQRRFGQLKNLLHVGIHESKVLKHFRVPVEYLFFLFFSRIFFFVKLEFNICVFSLNFLCVPHLE